MEMGGGGPKPAVAFCQSAMETLYSENSHHRSCVQHGDRVGSLKHL